jgi:hypothetical protein
VPNSFLVVGVARNCKKSISKTLKATRALLGPDSSVSFFIVESDSSDGTLETLEKLKIAEPQLNFTSLGNLAASQPDRIQRIATCRNVYLEHLESLVQAGTNPDFVVIADFDGVNRRVSKTVANEELFSPSKVVCANQFGAYYDILALRKPGWVEEDFRLTVKREVSQGTESLKSYIRNVSVKQRRIDPKSPRIQVESAFGGLAIYPSISLVGLRYKPALLVEDIYECEHVSLNLGVRRRGFDIEIQPGLQNSGALAHTILTFLPMKVLAFILVALRSIIGFSRRRQVG